MDFIDFKKRGIILDSNEGLVLIKMVFLDLDG